MQAGKKAPKGDRYYNKIAHRYEKKRQKQAWWHVEQQEMQSLLETLPKGLSVVDIPFGTGRFVPYYVERGFDISGLDASHDMLAAAKAALGGLYDQCRTVTGNAGMLPYADEQFDLLVSTRFLRDIVVFADAKKMLAEFARVTSRYAIIQLGENPNDDLTPAEDDVMGSKMARESVDLLLADHDLVVKDRRFVHSVDGEGDIHHILCEKV
ncbi:MAG: class I SAM-dependent methyltransferase [Pseudomonadota bacterium]